MKISLDYLELENFKGVRKFALQLDGSNAIIKGKNGTGKTTVADAFYWLLTDADSNFRKSLNPLLIEKDAKPLERVPAIAKIQLKIDSKTLSLTKVYSQKWTTRKGSNTPEFTGHTVEHFVNDVPVSQKDYNNKLNSYISLDLWRCLSDVNYFCSMTTADYRRYMLLDMIGGIDNEVIFADNSQLNIIKHYFEDRSAADIKKMLKLKKRHLTAKLDEIPARIDELQRGSADRKPADMSTIDEQISALDFEIRKKSEDQLVMTGATALIEKKKQLFELSAQVEIERKSHETALEKQYQLIVDLKKEESRLENDLDHLKQEITGNADRRAELGREHQQINTEKFIKTDRCFACNQLLPDDQISRQKEQFNKNQSAKLLTISGKGEMLFRKFNDLTAYKNTLTQNITAVKTKIAAAHKDYDQLKNHDLCPELHEKITAIKADIENKRIEEDPQFQVDMQQLEQKREALKREKREHDLFKEKQQRIESLEKKQTDLSKDLEQLEKELYLIDEFTRLKTERIEDKVNDKFDLTDWQLFDIQVNKDIKKVCEPLYKGIKYSHALNTGAKIHVGLDCIRAISKHYDISMPIFIDNAESITSWPTISAQIIKLVADATKDEMQVIL